MKNGSPDDPRVAWLILSAILQILIDTCGTIIASSADGFARKIIIVKITEKTRLGLF